MVQTDKVFNNVVESLQGRYPHRNIDLQGTLVYIDGECKFNTDGYCLLYNLKRLCEALENELL